jgi:hypothetical protein
MKIKQQAAHEGAVVAYATERRQIKVIRTGKHDAKQDEKD